jgi:aminoglycoside phosphotransferase (APT) family kinase protein
VARAPHPLVPPDTRRWVERSLGPGWRVVSVRRLTGGLSTIATRLRVEQGAGGERRSVVLRRFVHIPDDEPDAPARAAAVLDLLAKVAPHLPTPELLAADPDGRDTGGAPAVLMERLPGRIDLAPSDPDRWLGQMVDVLVAIHAVDVAPAERDAEEPWMRDWSSVEPPPWSRHPDRWSAAIDVVRREGPAVARTFVHGDYQHFNLLWSRGRLTGIVDWRTAHWWPPEIDVGHCRLNLAILYGADVAEDFRRRYEAASGRPLDPWWDLRETVGYLPSWAPGITDQVAGRIPFDAAAADRRVDDFLPVLLDRL